MLSSDITSSPPAMVVPFSTGSSSAASTTTYPAQNGNTTVAICAFGKFGIYSLGYGYDLSTEESRSFITPTSSVYTFTVATDISSINIHAEVFLSSALASVTYSRSPYVALAVANPWNDTFEIIPETVMTITTFAANTSYTQFSVYTNSLENISVSIPKGSRVAIVCGHNSSVSTYSTPSFCFSGGVALW